MVLTRPTTIFFLFIPTFEYFRKKRVETLKTLILATALMVFIAVTYNWLRFDNPLEFGYKHAFIPQEEFRKYRPHDRFDTSYTLNSLIYMIGNPPKPLIDKGLRYVFPYFELSRFGVGLAYVIPWFFPYLLLNPKLLKDWPYLLTAAIIAVGVLFFGGEGSFQIGPRYSLDFMPILIFLNLKWLSDNRPFRPVFMKLLALGVFLNIYFFFLVQLGHISRT